MMMGCMCGGCAECLAAQGFTEEDIPREGWDGNCDLDGDCVREESLPTEKGPTEEMNYAVEAAPLAPSDSITGPASGDV